MNELIQENWEKATGSAIPGPGFFASASDYNIEKFAELIVRECAQVAADFVPGYGLEPFSKQFKKHFGVEE